MHFPLHREVYVLLRMIGRGSLLALLARSAPAAQQPAGASSGNDPIPRAVVMAILRNIDGPGEPTISVGPELPKRLAGRISLPPGARIIATLDGPSTRVIAVAPGQPDSIRLWFAEEFERRGFAPIAPGGIDRTAFIPAERSASMLGFCSANAIFSATARDVGRGQVEFVLRVDNRGCLGAFSLRSYSFGGGSSSGFNPPDIPRLINPRSAGYGPWCATQGGVSSASAETRSSIASTMPTAQLLDHYGRQLDSAGWTRERTGAGTTGSWTRRDSTGRHFRVVVAAFPGGGGVDCRDLYMTVRDIP